MRKQGYVRRIVSLILAAVLIVGTMIKIEPKQVVASEAGAVKISMGFDSVDTDDSWYLTSPDITKVTAKYYKMSIKIDDATVEVPIEKTDNNRFVIWNNFFRMIDNSRSVPKGKLEIPAGTILEEINPNVTGWATAVEDGQTLKVTEALRVVKQNGNWAEGTGEPDNEPEISKTDIRMGFSFVETDNSWYLTSPDMAKVTAQYYKIAVRIDGKTVTVPIEKTNDNRFVIWCNLFNIIDSSCSVPTEKFEILPDTVMEEINPNVTGWATAVEGGQTLKVIEGLTVGYTSGVWAEEEAEYDDTEISLGFKLVDEANSWYLTCVEIAKATAQYYKLSVKIDGKTVELPAEKTEDGFVIWSTLFNVIDSSASAPTEKVEILKDTVLEEINPNVTGWVTAVEGGQTLKVTNHLSVVKENGSWAEEKKEQTKPKPVKPAKPQKIKVSLDFVEVDNSWYLLFDDAAKATAKYYKMSVKIDGKTVEIPVEKTENGFVIWSNFFAMIDNSASVPKEKLTIPAGTIMEEINPNVTGWATAVEGGQTLKVTKSITIVKNGTIWMPKENVAKQEKTTIKVGECTFNNGDTFGAKIENLDEIKDTKWYSAITDSQWGRVTATAKADGKEQPLVVAFPGNGEVFFYLDGAKESMVISKETEFVSDDGMYVVTFDKNYEIDLVDNFVFEQGKRPVEKEPMGLALSYNRLVGESFMFYWSMADGSTPEAGWYKAEAKVDGETRSILLEYYPPDDAVFIYQNCFASVPGEGSEGYPQNEFELLKDTVLTPISATSWSKNIEGQPYKLTQDIHIVKYNNMWMDAGYAEEISTLTPMEVKVVFQRILGRAVVLNVITPDGTSIDSIYGDWTTARGQVQRGVLEATTGNYNYTGENAAYSITGATFYLDNLRLSELEALQIDAGTILYADDSCKSNMPMKITNQLRIIRDEDDEWVVDKTFTTDYDLVAVSTNTSEAASTDVTEDDSQVEETEETAINVGNAAESSEYQAKNIVFYGESKEEMPVEEVKQSGNTLVIILAGTSILVIAVAAIVILMYRKKKA